MRTDEPCLQMKRVDRMARICRVLCRCLQVIMFASLAVFFLSFDGLLEVGSKCIFSDLFVFFYVVLYVVDAIREHFSDFSDFIANFICDNLPRCEENRMGAHCSDDSVSGAEDTEEPFDYNTHMYRVNRRIRALTVLKGCLAASELVAYVLLRPFLDGQLPAEQFHLGIGILVVANIALHLIGNARKRSIEKRKQLNNRLKKG